MARETSHAEFDDLKFNATRRHFLASTSLGLGATALALAARAGSLAGEPGRPRPTAAPPARPLLAVAALRPAKAKRVIYLFQSGGPSQLDLFDHKPMLRTMQRPGAAGVGPHGPAPDRHDREPEVAARWPARTSSSRSTASRHLGQRAAAAHRARSSTSCASSSRCTPRRSTTTRRSPSSRPARSWPAGRRWARGSPTASAPRTRTCPAFVVLLSRAREGDQPLYSRLWGSGFLPSQHQGVQFRARQDPVLYLSNPDGPRPHQPAAHARHAARARSSSSTHG